MQLMEEQSQLHIVHLFLQGICFLSESVQEMRGLIACSLLPPQAQLILLSSLRRLDDMASFRFPTTSASGEEMKQENLTSQINGSRTEFNISESFSSSSLRVYYNGVRQTSDEVTVTGSDSFSLSFTPTSGDKLLVDYTSS